MSLPSVVEAKQLARLRALRVQRAQAKRSAAEIELERAKVALAARERAILAVRAEIATLANAVVGELATDLPRWAGLADAARERLAEQLERECYALESKDQPALEAARAALATAQTELARERAREDVVRGLAHEAYSLANKVREQRAESELEDRPQRMAA